MTWKPIETVPDGTYGIVAEASLTYATFARKHRGEWLEYDGRGYDRPVTDMNIEWFMELPELSHQGPTS